MTRSKVTPAHVSALVSLYRSYARRKIDRKQFELAAKTIFREKKGA